MLPSKASLEVKGYGREVELYFAAFLSQRSEIVTPLSFESFLPALAASFCLQQEKHHSQKPSDSLQNTRDIF